MCAVKNMAAVFEPPCRRRHGETETDRKADRQRNSDTRLCLISPCLIQICSATRRLLRYMLRLYRKGRQEICTVLTALLYADYYVVRVDFWTIITKQELISRLDSRTLRPVTYWAS